MYKKNIIWFPVLIWFSIYFNESCHSRVLNMSILWTISVFAFDSLVQTVGLEVSVWKSNIPLIGIHIIDFCCALTQLPDRIIKNVLIEIRMLNGS